TCAASTPIHTFTAPEEGWLVNSHIVEFPSQLFVVDAQYTLPFAREVNRYALEEHEKLGDDVAAEARQPDRRIAEGEEVIDGIRIEHTRLREAETEDALI